MLNIGFRSSAIASIRPLCHCSTPGRSTCGNQCKLKGRQLRRRLRRGCGFQACDFTLRHSTDCGSTRSRRATRSTLIDLRLLFTVILEILVSYLISKLIKTHVDGVIVNLPELVFFPFSSEVYMGKQDKKQKEQHKKTKPEVYVQS